MKSISMKVRELIAKRSKIRHAMRSEDLERADGLPLLVSVHCEMTKLLDDAIKVVIEVEDEDEDDFILDVVSWEDGYIVLADDTIITANRVFKGGIRLITL